jgi:molybdopterin-containing oxidoreductase family iron-sulfur binding subunit
LEAWGDLSITKGAYSLTQPTIRPLFDTKQFEDVLMNLNGMSGDYYDYLEQASIIVGATWNKIVHDGVYVGVSQALSAGSVDYSTAASTLSRSKAARV